MMQKIIAAAAAALICGLIWAGMPEKAEAAAESAAGKINTNGMSDEDDVRLLQTWLLTGQDAQLSDWQRFDLNHDSRLDAGDLTAVKRLLLQNPDRTAPPVRVLAPSLPSVGNVRIPVFAVSFPDCSFPADAAEALEARCFSGAAPEDSLYPRESVSAYFDRASYSRIKLCGDVIRYTAKHPIDDYAVDHAQSLAAEIAEALDAQLDYQVYDADNDRRLDAFVIALPDSAIKIDRDGDGKPDWWPFSGASVNRGQFDGLHLGDYCVLVYDDRNPADFVGKAAHELCHAMGLPDYYRYTADKFGENDGMQGPAGYELMDEGSGDLSACSKLLLGWLSADEVQIYSGGIQTFSLLSMQDAPSCVLIPKEPDAGFLSEYFLIEYVTKAGNDSAVGGNGIRILHVQAEVSAGKHGMEFTYNNYGQHYEQSNEKQRVLRLVNESGMFYPGKNGLQYTDCITGDVPGFHWYDADGALTLDPGVQIKFDSFQPGPDFEPDPLSSRNYQDYPSFRKGSRFEITVSELE